MPWNFWRVLIVLATSGNFWRKIRMFWSCQKFFGYFSPMKIIFNAFRNNFGLVIFICEKQTRMCFHYSWRQFFASIKSENISVGLRIIPVPTKMILDSFWNNFRLVNFICEKHLKWFWQLRSISGYYPGKFQNDSGTLQELSGMCRNQFDLIVHPKTTFRFHQNSSDDLSLQNFSAVRNFFGIFSQTPCLVFSR